MEISILEGGPPLEAARGPTPRDPGTLLTSTKPMLGLHLLPTFQNLRCINLIRQPTLNPPYTNLMPAVCPLEAQIPTLLPDRPSGESEVRRRSSS